jgi:hypothetical protein
MTSTPTDTKKAPRLLPIYNSENNRIDLIVGDKVYHEKFGNGIVAEFSKTNWRFAKFNFEDGKQRQLVIPISPMLRYPRPKKNSTKQSPKAPFGANDLVNVSFVTDRGMVVETQKCRFSVAHTVGISLKKRYSDFFEGTYKIESATATTNNVVSISKAKKPTPKKSPRKAKPRIIVTHHFEIVS